MNWNTSESTQRHSYAAEGVNPPVALTAETFINTVQIGDCSSILSYTIGNHRAIVFAHIDTQALKVEAVATDGTIIFSESTSCSGSFLSLIWRCELKNWLIVNVSDVLYIFNALSGSFMGTLTLPAKKLYETLAGDIIARTEYYSSPHSRMESILYDDVLEIFTSTYLWNPTGEPGGFYQPTDSVVSSYDEPPQLSVPRTSVVSVHNVDSGALQWAQSYVDTKSIRTRGFDSQGNLYCSFLRRDQQSNGWLTILQKVSSSGVVLWERDFTEYVQCRYGAFIYDGQNIELAECLGGIGPATPWGVQPNFELEGGSPESGAWAWIPPSDVDVEICHLGITDDSLHVLHTGLEVKDCSYRYSPRISILSTSDGSLIKRQGFYAFNEAPLPVYIGLFAASNPEGNWSISNALFSNGSSLSIVGEHLDGLNVTSSSTTYSESPLPYNSDEFAKGCIVDGEFYYPRSDNSLSETYINVLGDPYVDDRDLRNRCKNSNCPPHNQVTLFGEPNIDLGNGSSYVGALKGNLPASPGYGWQMSSFMRIEHRINGDLVFYDGTGMFERWVQADDKYFPAHPDNTTKAEKLTGDAVQLTFRDGSVLKFDADNRAETWTDRNNNTLTYHYSTTTPVRLERIEDSQGHETSFDYTRADGQPDAMRLSTATSGADRVTSYEYYPSGHDNEHRLKKVTDPAGETMEYVYDDENRLLQIKDTRGQIATEFTYYPTDGRVETQRNYGQLIHRAYDDGNRSVTMTTSDLETMQDDRVSIYFYDEYRNVVEERHQIDGEWLVTTRKFGDSSNPYLLTEVVNPNNATTTYRYSARGNLLETEDAQGNKVAFSYAENTDTNLDLLTSVRKISTENALDSTETIFHYYGNGNIWKVQDALGNVTEFGYTPDGLLSWSQDRLGHRTDFEYTGSASGGTSRNLDRVVPPTGSARGAISYTYDDFDNVQTITNALGTVSMTHDNVDRVVSVEDARNKLTSFSIIDGLVEEVLSPGNDATGSSRRLTTLEYDGSGRLTEVLRQVDVGTQSRVKYGYDGFSQLTWLERKKHSGNAARVDYGYDVLGRPTTVQDTLNRTTNIAHEKLCKSNSVTSPRGIRTVSHFDSLCRLTEVSVGTPGAGDFDFSELRETRSFDYDSFGRLTESTQAPASFQGPSSIFGSASYGISTYGGSSSGTDGNKRSFKYDKLDRLKEIVFEDNEKMSFDYDAEGQLITKVEPGEKVTKYTYTPDGLLQRVKVERDGTLVGEFVYAYDQAGLPVTLTYPAATGIVAEFKTSGGARGWNANGQLTNLRYLKNSALIREFELDYDDSGNLTEQTEISSSGTIYRKYSYDYLDRLVKVEKSVGSEPLLEVSIYSYDESDNRTQFDLPQELVRYIYAYHDDDSPDTMTKVDTDTSATLFTETFVSDSDGNLTSRINDLTEVTISYLWDDFNKLIAVSSSDPGGPTNDAKQENSYLSNGFRRKKKAKSGEVTTEYSAGLSTAIAKAGADPISYIQGHHILGFEQGDSFYWFLTDALGSVRDIVSGTDGAVLQSYEYRENGEKTSSTSLKSDKTWVGGLSVNDDTADSGLYLMGHRHYDATLGRFLSRDPIGFAGGLNLYEYASSSPAQMVDPDGLEVHSPAQYARWAKRQGEVIGVIPPADRDKGFANVATGALMILSAPRAAAQGVWYGGNALWQAGARQTGARMMAAGASGSPTASVLAAGGASSQALRPCPDRGITPLPGTRVRPAGVPENWRIRPTNTRGGTEYFNPRNRNESVRIMQGRPNSPYPNSRQPYARQRNNAGLYLDADGNPGANHSPETHIPLDQFIFRSP